eukprot:1158157-Pelagomonas_calceolata.AAC.13
MGRLATCSLCLRALASCSNSFLLGVGSEWSRGRFPAAGKCDLSTRNVSQGLNERRIAALMLGWVELQHRCTAIIILCLESEHMHGQAICAGIEDCERTEMRVHARARTHTHTHTHTRTRTHRLGCEEPKWEVCSMRLSPLMSWMKAMMLPGSRHQQRWGAWQPQRVWGAAGSVWWDGRARAWQSARRAQCMPSYTCPYLHAEPLGAPCGAAVCAPGVAQGAHDAPLATQHAGLQWGHDRRPAGVAGGTASPGWMRSLGSKWVQFFPLSIYNLRGGTHAQMLLHSGSCSVKQGAVVVMLPPSCLKQPLPCLPVYGLWDTINPSITDEQPARFMCDETIEVALLAHE